MYTYTIKDFKTAKLIDGLQLAHLSAPAFVNTKIVHKGFIYDVVEIAHDLNNDGIETHKTLFVTKIM